MKIDNKSLHTLLILGAGATRGALSTPSPNKINPPLNCDYFDILEKYVHTTEGKKYLSAYNRLKNFIDNEIGQKGIENISMEQVFNVLFISKDLPEIFNKGRGRRRLAGYRQGVKDFLSLLIRLFHFIQLHSKNKNSINHYELIVKNLSAGDIIMSLNYDTLIDNELVKGGWNPSKGYAFKPQIKYETPKTKIYSDNLRDVLLLKPHGSFNWFAKGSFNNLEKALERRPVSVVILSKLPRLYQNKKDRLLHFFIPPLYTKYFKNSFWTNLWVKTYEAAKRVDRIVIIGCSLIATDYHLRAILSKAITDKKTKYKEIVVVDKSKRTREKLKSFFRGSALNGVTTYSNFSTFCIKTLK
ncbi:MAG: hypothetical protein WC490_06655 [Candidatus Margulisiibacteriota bacterium]